ncbi:thioredoxin family protein [Pseudonocardia sp. NPDC046786]|uniref:thioredoxin family protein n=1 Tax=Pseudonocardia sp. NPDC046786 TaxID=3155471 RepID=UPI0033D6B4B2
MQTGGLVVLIVVLALATVAGLVLRNRSGRVRTTTPARAAGPGGWELAGIAPDGRRALLLQLSSPVCTPCRQTARLLGDLAAADPGLAHVEVDVAERIEVARTLGVLRTPTTVVFDSGGAEILRISGVPRADELADALPAAPA